MWSKVTFEVIPISYIKNQYDTILSNDVISALNSKVEEAIKNIK